MCCQVELGRLEHRPCGPDYLRLTVGHHVLLGILPQTTTIRTTTSRMFNLYNLYICTYTICTCGRVNSGTINARINAYKLRTASLLLMTIGGTRLDLWHRSFHLHLGLYFLHLFVVQTTTLLLNLVSSNEYIL